MWVENVFSQWHIFSRLELLYGARTDWISGCLGEACSGHKPATAGHSFPGNILSTSQRHELTIKVGNGILD